MKNLNDEFIPCETCICLPMCIHKLSDSTEDVLSNALFFNCDILRKRIGELCKKYKGTEILTMITNKFS